MAGKTARSGSFRVGKVKAYMRGEIWYLCYFENGKRRRPRVGPDRDVAKQLAAQTNAQIEVGAPALLSFEPLAISELRERWLQHHEQVLRSSVQTINRYRTATAHLLHFLQDVRPVRLASQFRVAHAEEFVRHLRVVEVAPNGHANTVKRPLLDKGVKYILETCRAMFNYAAKRRHLSPYAPNPFSELELDRIPLERTRPLILFTAEQEKAFLASCDDWQFPMFLTLTLTGLRPGELTHLMLPDDLDLDAGVLRVRNRPELGWQVKTRNEREVPLVPVLAEVLRASIGSRRTGPVFRRRRFGTIVEPLLGSLSVAALTEELRWRIAMLEEARGGVLGRAERLKASATVWRDAGCIKTDRLRREYMRLTRRIGLRALTEPKMLRHLFATTLQDANVDPLIRNELLGHVPEGRRSAGFGLAMTAVYTHTRAETRRRQLADAFRGHPAVAAAMDWLLARRAEANSEVSVGSAAGLCSTRLA
jgi:integrase